MATSEGEHFKVRNRVHMIGIGGAGMAPLAQLLSASRVYVTGSDARASLTLQMLRELKIQTYVGHDATHVGNPNAIIVSPAIPRANPELVAARARGVPVLSRAEALAELIRTRVRVCITGSHGKTTTTAMLAFLMERCGLDPGYMIGGSSASLGANAKLGSGPFVMEACEAFGALQNWQAAHCIVTSLDDEHSDHYGSFSGLRLAFRLFVERVTPEGIILVCGDDAELVRLTKETSRRVITYGLSGENDFRAVVNSMESTGSTFDVFREGRFNGHFVLPLPGQHNIRNALAAVAMANCFGIPISAISLALSEFYGVERRCQLIGSVHDVQIYDDYAHHPTEVRASLAVARSAVRDGGRVMVAFEGLLHSRVLRLASSFASALASADFVTVLPTDAAGESNLESSEDRLSDSLIRSGVAFVHASTSANAATELLGRLRPGDVMIAIGPTLARSVGPLVRDGLSLRGIQPGTIAAKPSTIRGPQVDAGTQGTLLHRFLEHTLIRPNALAAECGREMLTYAELAHKARALSSQLLKAGSCHGEVVAVQLHRSTNRVVAFLGVLFAGGVYLPLDPGAPSERVDFILADGKVRFMITDQVTTRSLNIINMPRVGSYTHLLPEAEPNGLPSSADAAYIIYTSGTTGTPKGVIVEHAALHNVIRASATKFNIGPLSRVSQVSTYGFDIAVGDMALGIYSGASLIFPEENSAQPGSPLGRYISKAAITHLSLTPSALSTVPFERYSDLSHIIVCGERCPSDLAARWMVGYRFFNAYGPAEATVWCSVDECQLGSPVTIGKPLDNISIALLDEHERPVTAGTEGEIWIFGSCLARGYLNRDELNRERFRMVNVENELVRAYRTGDIAVLCADQRIQFLGRVDDQIKIRGFRVEPGEIEEALRRYPNVVEAAVCLHKDQEGVDRLVAYLVTREITALRLEDVIAFLGSWLPGHMIPSTIMPMKFLPRNRNQKLDYRSLPNPFLELQTNDRGSQRAETGTEAAIIEILKSEFTSIANCGICDTFTSLGMDSLQTARIFAVIERSFGIQLSAEAYARANTAELLAKYVDKAASEPIAAPPNQGLTDTIVRKQLTHLAAWTGVRNSDQSLICGHNVSGTRPPLYWCFQGSPEHEALALHLGSSQPVYGMRSGYLVFRYKDENIRILAKKYADEIIELQPEGGVVLGGNCQGGIIAHATAEELLRRGRTVSLLCLLGPTRFSSFPGPVALIFSKDSKRHPYITMRDPEGVFRSAYGTSYTVSTIPGDDESQFDEPNILTLAEFLSGALYEAFLDEHRK